MNHDEPEFEKKVPKFSVVRECPKCGQLSLSFREGKIICSNCGYGENVTAIK
jgi:ribosomal protein L37E